jgi:DNA-binding response OmpR family regulator
MLVVDQDDSTDRAVKRFFEFRGYRVDCAHEPEEAEALLANYAYAIVICGPLLSPAHGAEGLRILRFAHECCPAARAVMIGAPGHAEIDDEAKSRGIEVLERSRILGLLECAVAV